MSGLDVDDGEDGIRGAEAQLKAAGLDLFRWFSVPKANQSLHGSSRLPDSGTAALIIGNTCAIWKPFRDAQATRPRAQHPLDAYVEDSIRGALAPLRPSWLRFSHELLPTPIPIQRYAALSGLAEMSPAGLSIHSTYGPWIALRAVAVFDASKARAQEPVAPHPCTSCAAPCLRPFEEAMRAPERTLRSFLPVRLSCPVGTAHRYSAEQIDYHYGREP